MIQNDPRIFTTGVAISCRDMQIDQIFVAAPHQTALKARFSPEAAQRHPERRGIQPLALLPLRRAQACSKNMQNIQWGLTA